MGLFNWLFRKMCNRIFYAVDRDHSGFIEEVEVEVAIYRLYNIINKRLPGWQDPPSRKEIQNALRSYDVDGNNRLDKAEFCEFARGLVKNGPDMFFARVGKDAVTRAAVLPVAARGVQMGAAAGGLKEIAAIPLAVTAPVIGTVWNAVKAILPFGL